MKTNPTIKLTVFLSCLLAWANGFGLSSDRDKPLEIEADSAEMDDSQGNAVYRGNVVAVQGSMRITGDVLTIKYTPGHEIQVVLVDGNPAHFKQKMDGSEEEAKGEAIKMEYHVTQNLLYLIEKAKVTQRRQIYLGHKMSYDTERSFLTIKKGDANEPGANGNQRVKTIILPEKSPAAEKKPTTP
jgi:lipopolysaccharide export system protein LptA